MEAQISADVRDYVAAIDRAIDANIKFASSVGLTGRQVDAIDKNLNNARKAIVGSTNDTLAQERALKKAEKAWDAQNRIYEDYLRHQERATSGVAAHTASLAAQEGNLIRTRYALYDVATTYAAVSAATLGAVTATSLFAARYETAFTEIERTTLDSAGRSSAGLEGLREQFLDLSEVLPLTFQELTKIGSLGAQLGIAEADLVSFTDTVAKFSRLSGISAEESALAFGRIGELLDVPAAKYENLGSAIAFVASKSNTTEAQLISVTKEIAAAASGAGFTAAEVVGLAGSLASLGVAPEKSRGSLETFFGTLNLAVADGGQRLSDFATVVGVTSEQLEAMVRNGQGEEVLRGFVEGLNDIRGDNVAVTASLERLGLAQLRVTDTFRRLSQNLNQVEQDMGNAQTAFEKGLFLDQAFAVVLDDVASQFQLLLNSIGRFLATAGQPFLEFLRTALPAMAGFFGALTEIAGSPVGQTLFRAASALLILVGALAAVRAAAALTVASLFAIKTASLALGGTGIIASLGTMATTLGFVSASGNRAAFSMLALNGAIGGLAARLGLIGLVATAFIGLTDIVLNGGKDMSRALDQNLGSFYAWYNGVSQALGQTEAQAAQSTANIRRNMELMAASILAGPLGGIFQFFNSGGFGGAKVARTKGPASSSFKNPNQGPAAVTNPYATATGGAEDYASALDGVGSSAGGAGRQVRTLVDYANDLSSVFSRSFDIRFGSQLAVDDVADSWDALAQRIRDARIEIQQLTADRSIKEYFLSVADAYGDTLRGDVLRGEIAELNEKIAETQADASTELQGNSKAARQNRSVLTGLIKNYEDYITALAAGGADQSELNAAVNKSRAEFLAQAQALGFSNTQLQPYIASFDDLSTVIANVPRNITVTANVNPALQALNEFVAQARSAGGAAGAGFSEAYSDALKKQARGAAILASIQSALAIASNPAEPASRRVLFGDRARSLSDLYNSGQYYTGGYTGRGGKYDPAGVVHKGEYVVPKSGVNQATGLPKPSYMNALGGQMPSSRGASYAGGGPVRGGGALMVELSPTDRAILRAAGGSGDVVIAVDSVEIARASNKGNKQMVAMGGQP
jgi:TP901 family phage tail tape measure protein